MTLLSVFVAIVASISGWTTVRSQFGQYWYYLGLLPIGFGIQVGLFVYVRRLLSRRARGGAAAATATGSGTSTVAMVACCAHHVTDALPVLGLSGAAIFLNDYRIPLMSAGLAVNAAGALYMGRLAIVHTRRARLEASACSG